MEEKILLRRLLKGSSPYRIVRELKSHDGELNFEDLERNLKIEGRKLVSVITALYPCVVQDGKKISLSKEYDFVAIGSRNDICYLRER